MRRCRRVFFWRVERVLVARVPHPRAGDCWRGSNLGVGGGTAVFTIEREPFFERFLPSHSDQRGDAE